VTGPDRGGWSAWIFTKLAVLRAGGRPLRLRPARFDAGEALPAFDALVLGGGADIEPSKAGLEKENLLPPEKADSDGDGKILAWLLAPLLLLFRGVLAIHHASVDTARDAFEERCLKQALEAGYPILGICRGAQLINIYSGGNLHGELSEFYGESGNPASVYPRKNIAIAEDSLLHSTLGQGSLLVNSFHKQAVNHLGDGIMVSATDDFGVTQAIESTQHTWVLGVQWHPEFLPTLKRHQRLFRALVRAASCD
jgi:putative glutamine amidotransferase